VAALLSAIHEEDFLRFSYGFRPKRSQHDALDALIVGISSKKVNFILDADIRSFFTEVSQSWVIRFLEHRIGGTRILRLVQKWLRAGVLEDGIVTIEEKGTGQGSVISPLLANVYLHYVFDLWAERWRRREATGDMIMVSTPTTSSSASSMRATPAASGARCATGCGSSRCRFIRTRPA
jgi:RNA-directed DNA polymerase